MSMLLNIWVLTSFIGVDSCVIFFVGNVFRKTLEFDYSGWWLGDYKYLQHTTSNRQTGVQSRAYQFRTS